MRFEIGPGGGFIILVGLLGLSAAVFFLGMISGREMAQSEQGQSQLASVYPMPSDASAVSPPPAAAATLAPASRPAPSSENIPPAVLPKKPPRPALASAPHRSAPAAEAPDDSSAPSDETDAGAAAASVRTPNAETRRRGYYIVIDAAMDRPAADRMASRLVSLGYTSHVAPSEVNGQTWYRLRVGPYPTSDDARAAETQLRAAYAARYVNHTRAAASTGSAGGAPASAGAAAGATDTDTSDSGASDTDSDDSGGGDSGPSGSKPPTD